MLGFRQREWAGFAQDTWNLLGNTRGNPPFSLTAFNTPNAPLSAVTPPAQVAPVDPAVVHNGDFAYVTLIDPKLRTPYGQNWNLGVQHAITPTLTLEVNYVGVKGTHIFRTADGNAPQPNLVSQLVAYCGTPNAFGCTSSTLQFSTLWDGAELFPSMQSTIMPSMQAAGPVRLSINR